jgi:predicted DNA-binding transcriptional regulator
MSKTVLDARPLIEPESLQTIRAWFYAYPLRAIGLADLSRETGLSKSSVRAAVKRLAHEGHVRIETVGNVWRITTQPSRKLSEHKSAYALNLIHDSRLVESIANEYPNARAIILFGSYRSGEDTEKSDIDIAIELAGTAPVSVRPYGSMHRFGFRTNVPIQLTLFTRTIDVNLFNNIANGIVLRGFLEVSP